jgi:hypothetical protein
MWIIIFLNQHMRAQHGSQFSPAQYGPSQITVSLPNKRPAQDVLAISAPQLPPKRIRAEKQCRKALGQNLRAVGQRDTAKTHVREWIVMGGIADDPQALSEQD